MIQKRIVKPKKYKVLKSCKKYKAAFMFTCRAFRKRFYPKQLTKRTFVRRKRNKIYM